jgi:hypothetical protein
MANVLSETKRQQVLALGRLGWPLRRIEEALGVRRETASAYLKAAGIGIRAERQRRLRPRPASEVSTDPEGAKPASGGEVSTDSAPARTPLPAAAPGSPDGPAPRVVRPRSQSALWRRAPPLRRGRSAVPRARSGSEGQGREQRRSRVAHAAQRTVLRVARRGADLPGPLGAHLGRYPHPRHHQTMSKRASGYGRRYSVSLKRPLGL